MAFDWNSPRRAKFFFAMWMLSLRLSLCLLWVVSKAGDVLQAQDKTIREQTAALSACHAELDVLHSAATVLYEPDTAEGIDPLALLGLPAGLIQLQPGKAFGQQRMAWFIPFKVKPIVYGDGAGRAYAWYDRQGKPLAGPFAPEAAK